MSETRNLRRYALHQWYEAELSDMTAIRDVWAGKQDEIPGEALPDGFPLKARLAEFRYTTYEDLDGADVYELAELGFAENEAKEILAAAAAA